MGDYASRTDLLGRFDDEDQVAYLTGDEATGTADTAALDDALESAEGEVNVRLAARYSTPVSTTEASVVAFLKRLTLDLAEAYLRLRHRPVGDDTQKQIDRALETLDKVAEGSYRLPGVAVLASTASSRPARWTGSGRTLSDTSKRLFTRETTAGL